MEVMSTSSSMDNSFSSSHEAEGKNVATYYFRHESGDSEECETSSDEGMGRSTAALNYSREDIQALATKAELMVLGRMENRRELFASGLLSTVTTFTSMTLWSPSIRTARW